MLRESERVRERERKRRSRRTLESRAHMKGTENVTSDKRKLIAREERIL